MLDFVDFKPEIADFSPHVNFDFFLDRLSTHNVAEIQASM